MQIVLLHDVDQHLREEGWDVSEPDYILCDDVLYADDTMLLSSNPAKLQCRLDFVVDEGMRYGLELIWKKTLAMRIRKNGEKR